MKRNGNAERRRRKNRGAEGGWIWGGGNPLPSHQWGGIWKGASPLCTGCIHLFVCVSQNAYTKRDFLKMVSIDGPTESPTWAFQTNYWTPKIKDGGHPPS